MTSLATHTEHGSDPASIAAQYPVGNVTASEAAAEGIENSNFFLTTDTGEYVLTRLLQASFAGDALVGLLDHCHRAGLPTPHIIRTNDGAPFGAWGDQPALLCRRLPGRHLQNPTLAQCRALGRFVGRFHESTGHLAADMPAYPRTIGWLTDIAERASTQIAYDERATLDTAMRSTRSLLGRADVDKLPHGVVHADLFRDNALFNERGLTGVLDFHHAAAGWLIFDLAVAANAWCVDANHTLDTEHTLAMLTAYHNVRPLEKHELWLFPAFAQYAALVFWLARLDVRLTAPDKKRSRDPDEYRDIVRGHCARFFYPDARLFGY